MGMGAFGISLFSICAHCPVSVAADLLDLYAQYEDCLPGPRAVQLHDMYRQAYYPRPAYTASSSYHPLPRSVYHEAIRQARDRKRGEKI
nr:MAG TPA: hypothetical protein [Caudoviricetes sp.]